MWRLNAELWSLKAESQNVPLVGKGRRASTMIVTPPTPGGQLDSVRYDTLTITVHHIHKTSVSASSLYPFFAALYMGCCRASFL